MMMMVVMIGGRNNGRVWRGGGGRGGEGRSACNGTHARLWITRPALTWHCVGSSVWHAWHCGQV